jgi:TonB family protein
MIVNLNYENDKKERIKGIMGTVLFHVLLLIVLILIKLIPMPIPQEEDEGGILINFGNTETGSGSEVPQSMDKSTPTPPQPTQVTPVKNDNVVTQDLEHTVAIKNHKKDTKKPPVDKPVVKNNQTTTTQTEVTPQQKPKALFPSNNNNDVTSQGKTGGSGDQGDPKGNPFSNGNSQVGGGDNPLGTGGEGIGLSMTGRKIIKYPTITDNSQKTGRVVVNIKVDKNGNVIYAEATRSGSTTDDSYLFNLAVKAAYQTKLNSISDNEEQFGKMTFTFKVK